MSPVTAADVESALSRPHTFCPSTHAVNGWSAAISSFAFVNCGAVTYEASTAQRGTLRELASPRGAHIPCHAAVPVPGQFTC